MRRRDPQSRVRAYRTAIAAAYPTLADKPSLIGELANAVVHAPENLPSHASCTDRLGVGPHALMLSYTTPAKIDCWRIVCLDTIKTTRGLMQVPRLLHFNPDGYLNYLRDIDLDADDQTDLIGLLLTHLADTPLGARAVDAYREAQQTELMTVSEMVTILNRVTVHDTVTAAR